MWPAVFAAGFAIDIVDSPTAHRRDRCRGRTHRRRCAYGVDSRMARLRSELQPRQRCAAVHCGRGARHDACAGGRLSGFLSRGFHRRGGEPDQLDSLVDQHHRGCDPGRPDSRGLEPAEPCAIHRALEVGRAVDAGGGDLRATQFWAFPTTSSAGRRWPYSPSCSSWWGPSASVSCPAAGASFAISALTAYSIAFGRGAFGHIDELHGLITIWTLIAALTGLTLIVTALLAERDAASLERLRAEQRYAQIFNGSPQPIWVHDRDTFEVPDDQRGGGAPVWLEPFGFPVDDASRR